MDRLACVNIPSLPLQILLERHPEWEPFPVAVVDKNHPQGTILWVNHTARQHHIGPGLRYAAGRSICTELRADAVSIQEIEQWVTTLTHELYQFTPEVEASRVYPGIFWLNATGLSRLYSSLRDWAFAVQAFILQKKFQNHVCIGFTRFGTYAAARTTPQSIEFRETKTHGGESRRPHKTDRQKPTPQKPNSQITLFETIQQESRNTQQALLEQLDLPHRFRAALSKLAIKTVGQLLALPAAGLRNRLGKERMIFIGGLPAQTGIR